ncbi:MAG: peptidylprolyl isomerase [Proteobacteria bacterium]|nr:peptidylprolyl isomerase [Pseudomonadota bacterium]
MRQAKTNDLVRVHYTGSLKDGTVFDSSLDRQPLEFKIGHGVIIPGFENGIIGMKEGDAKVISIPPEDAYGPHRDDLVGVIETARIPDNITPKVGMVLKIRSPEGEMIKVTVTDVNETGVTLDMNHQLAGKELIFELKLVEVISE